jgi:molecular chaperone GrpE
MTNTEPTLEMDDSTMNESQNEEENQVAVQADEAMAESDVNELSKQLEEAQQQAADAQDKMLRVQAEMENLRKRTERDVSNAQKFAVEKFANELLQVKDSLELGLSAEDIDVAKLQEGTELTLRMLSNAFEKFAIEEINPVGEAFDPNLHEAMTMQESAEHQPNTVLTVIQKGYTIHGRLIRPAMVIVAKAPA